MSHTTFTPVSEITGESDAPVAGPGSPEATDAPVRAFYRSDYRRLAADFRRTRHTMGNYSNPKPAEQQATVDAAVNALADILQADSDAHGVPGVAAFDRDAFVAGTML